MPGPGEELHVVFGAAGGLGAAVVRRLVAEGEPARAVVRDPSRARDLVPEEVELGRGDALDPQRTWTPAAALPSSTTARTFPTTARWSSCPR